jgi:hypothetical protein
MPEFLDTNTILIICAVIAMFFAFTIINGKKGKPSKPIQNIAEPEVPKDEAFPYTLNDSLLTHKESLFYRALTPITASLGLTVFAKIRLADIVSTPKGTEVKWFNYIKAKHVDFIVCRELRPVLLIEVDDSTHDRPDRKERDDFVDKIFAQLGLPLLHIRRWQGDELEKQIKEALGIKEEAGL